MTSNAEQSYLDLLSDILYNGVLIDNTLCQFNKSISYDIVPDPPHYKIMMLTTKKMNFNTVMHELKFFMNGYNDINILKSWGCNIWNANTTKEQCAKKGLKECETGPFYGWQWNYSGAEYPNTDGGINQLQYVIDELTTNPTSRRAIINAWVPKDINKMCLPPCHVMYQFYIVNDRLNVTMTQRSGDMFLGVPFNIVSTSLLLIYMSNILNILPRNVHINITNAHIYTNHIDACKIQLANILYDMPTLTIKKNIKSLADCKTIMADDFELEYQCNAFIKADMTVT